MSVFYGVIVFSFCTNINKHDKENHTNQQMGGNNALINFCD